MQNPHTRLAYQTIKHHLETGQVLNLPADLPKEMLKKQAGTFVSLHQKDGALRGCIGTFLPTQKNIAQEIIRNAIDAATQDPRFSPVTLKELPNLEISVDILSKPKLVKKNFRLGDLLPRGLNPKKYGLLVTASDGRRGLLLPGIPSVDSAKKQVKFCFQKAGLSSKEKVDLEIFEVQRHQRN